jgi:hypothetical protein
MKIIMIKNQEPLSILTVIICLFIRFKTELSAERLSPKRPDVCVDGKML